MRTSSQKYLLLIIEYKANLHACAAFVRKNLHSAQPTALDLALKLPCWFHTQLDISQLGAGSSFLPSFLLFFPLLLLFYGCLAADTIIKRHQETIRDCKWTFSIAQNSHCSYTCTLPPACQPLLHQAFCWQSKQRTMADWGEAGLGGGSGAGGPSMNSSACLCVRCQHFALLYVWPGGKKKKGHSACGLWF